VAVLLVEDGTELVSAAVELLLSERLHPTNPSPTAMSAAILASVVFIFQLFK